MTHESLEQLFKKNQTNQIVSQYFRESCAPDVIPSAFSNCLAEVFNIIASRFSEIAFGKSKIAIVGLQTSALSIESNIPKKLQRIFSKENSNLHLCCVLSYLPISESESDASDWSNAKSLVIDFTDGVVMDEKKYIAKILKSEADGNEYGKLPSNELCNAWKQFQENTMAS